MYIRFFIAVCQPSVKHYDCIAMLANQCKVRPITTTKTIKLEMYHAEEILKEHPDLKVFIANHLIPVTPSFSKGTGILFWKGAHIHVTFYLQKKISLELSYYSVLKFENSFLS